MINSGNSIIFWRALRSKNKQTNKRDKGKGKETLSEGFNQKKNISRYPKS